MFDPRHHQTARQFLADPRNWRELASSCLSGAAFYPGGSGPPTLAVRLRLSGKVYYYECPESVWQALILAPSKGTYYNQTVKRFPSSGPVG